MPMELFEKFGLTAEKIVENALEILKSKDRTASQTTPVREITDIMHEINHVNKESITEIPKKPIEENDPRGRIIKMSHSDKKKVDDVLYKMFGGRKS
jgi:hypothetical protein